MKKLSKKTFITIFSLLSLFVVFILVLFNIQSYNKEYAGIDKSLNLIHNGYEKKHEKDDFDDFDDDEKKLPPNLDNMRIMDYDVYTASIDDGVIKKINYHGSDDDDFDINKALNSILKSNQDKKIGFLYTSAYSYNFAEDTIVVVNNHLVNSKLRTLLIISILIFLLSEILIYFLSKVITKWIVKPAKESFEKQRNFIDDASHELKTPLAIIMASADELKSNKKNEKYVENIRYEADRMSNLIQSMLSLSKLGSDVVKQTYKEENISKIVLKTCLTFEAVAFEKNVLIETDIDDDITLKCSKDEIEKLISINLDNAIKHSFKNSTVHVKMKKDKNILIEITNEGKPIKKGEEEKIFERFYRSDKSRNRDSNRYGLGLAIAKTISENYGGSITASSNDNTTTFRIVLNK